MFLIALDGGRIGDVKRYPDRSECLERKRRKVSISYVQQKTNTLVEVPIIQHAKAVINHYQGALPKLPNDAKTNRLLKDILKAAGIKRTIQLRDKSIDGPTHEVAPIADLISTLAAAVCATNIYNMNVLSLAELRSFSAMSRVLMLSIVWPGVCKTLMVTLPTCSNSSSSAMCASNVVVALGP